MVGFGKKKRMALRRFRQLLGLDIRDEADIRADPMPFLELASEQLYRLENALREASEAARTSRVCAAEEAVTISRAEYEGLLACRAIVDKALAG